LTYHILEWGAEEPALDHTVVLLHGFLDLAWSWQPMVEAGLAGRFHVVAPDLRGHGDTDPVGAGGYYHFADYLADVEAVVAATARARVSLVGHSMGGSVAGYFAGTFPDRVSRLVLCEGTGPPETMPSGPERTARWLESCQRVRRAAPPGYTSLEEAAERLRRHDPRLGGALALWLAERGCRRDPDGRVRFKHDPLHVTLGPYAFQVEVALRFWQAVRCPVLLVEGAESLFRHSPAEAARRSAAFAQVEQAVIADAGHMMQRHQPAALARLIGDFLAR
jgi:pimeloyl-ACP methyl ester carboxylesterase